MSTTIMTAPPKVAYPPPPPTTNALTVQRRAQLMRSSVKLSKVLGCTPHLVDDHLRTQSLAPMHVHLPLPQVSLHSRASSETMSSDNSSRSSSPSANAGFAHSELINLKECSPKSRLKSTVASVGKLNEVWPTSTSLASRASRAALLNLTLPSIPASPGSSPVSPSSSSSLVSSPDTDSPQNLCNPIFCVPSSDTQPCRDEDEFELRQFIIPSASTARRAKMNRLRRLLGDGVPLDMVFPDVARSTGFPQTKSPIETFDNESPSPLNTLERKVTPTYRIRRVPVPVYSDDRNSDGTKSSPSPSPPITPSASSKALGTIIESADEHGGSCGEEFRFMCRTSSTQTVTFKQQQHRPPMPTSYLAPSVSPPPPYVDSVSPPESQEVRGWYEEDDFGAQFADNTNDGFSTGPSSPLDNDEWVTVSSVLASSVVPSSQWFSHVEREFDSIISDTQSPAFVNPFPSGTVQKRRPSQRRCQPIPRKDSFTLYPDIIRKRRSGRNDWDGEV